MSSTHVRPRKIEIASYTSVLYGVFVTEKSYLLGIKRLVQREHVAMLVRKVAGHCLPPELVEMIMDHMLQSQEYMLQEVWKLTTATGNACTTGQRWYIWSLELSPAERAVQERLSRICVSATIVKITRPGYISEDFNASQAVSKEAIRHATCKLIHLTATTKPGLSSHVPQQRSALPVDYDDKTLASPEWDNSEGYIMTSSSKIGAQASECTTIVEQGHDMNGLMPTYMFEQAAFDASIVKIPCTIPKADEVAGLDKQHANGLGLQRMIQIDGVEDAMQFWDADALDQAIDLLRLQIVPFKKGDPRKPGLYIAPDLTVTYK